MNDIFYWQRNFIIVWSSEKCFYLWMWNAPPRLATRSCFLDKNAGKVVCQGTYVHYDEKSSSKPTINKQNYTPGDWLDPLRVAFGVRWRLLIRMCRTEFHILFSVSLALFNIIPAPLQFCPFLMRCTVSSSNYFIFHGIN